MNSKIFQPHHLIDSMKNKVISPAISVVSIPQRVTKVRFREKAYFCKKFCAKETVKTMVFNILNQSGSHGSRIPDW